MPALPRRPTASGPAAEWCRGVVDYLKALTPTRQPGIRTNWTTGGVGRLGDFNNPGGGTRMRLCRVKTIAAEYLTCVTWDGVTEGTIEFDVLKPDTLRPSFQTSETIPEVGDADEVTVNYGYTGGDQHREAEVSGDSEYQIIIPPYHEDKTEIMAARVNLTADDVKYKWLDLNIAGRAFLAYEECE